MWSWRSGVPAATAALYSWRPRRFRRGSYGYRWSSASRLPGTATTSIYWYRWIRRGRLTVALLPIAATSASRLQRHCHSSEYIVLRDPFHLFDCDSTGLLVVLVDVGCTKRAVLPFAAPQHGVLAATTAAAYDRRQSRFKFLILPSSLCLPCGGATQRAYDSKPSLPHAIKSVIPPPTRKGQFPQFRRWGSEHRGKKNVHMKLKKTDTDRRKHAMCCKDPLFSVYVSNGMKLMYLALVPIR